MISYGLYWGFTEANTRFISSCVLPLIASVQMLCVSLSIQMLGLKRIILNKTHVFYKSYTLLYILKP